MRLQICVFSAVALVTASFHGERCRAAAGDENWDTNFGVPGANGAVSAIAVLGRDVYFGGGFSSIGGINATGLARWDGTNWLLLGIGLDGGVTSLFVSGTDLYVAGGFSHAGGIPATNIARWDGSTWTSVAVLAPLPRALALAGNMVYAGGAFQSVGGIGATNVAGWDGRGWLPLADGVGLVCLGYVPPPYECGSGVWTLAAQGSRLYVGGDFRSAGGIDADNIAEWDGANWAPLAEGLRTYNAPNVPNSSNGRTRALLAAGDKLYAGGEFNLAGSVGATNVARWDGTNWSALGGGTERNSSVQALALNGRDLYAGGFFHSAGGSSAANIAKWDGATWSSLGSGIGGTVRALASDGANLFVGGGFGAAGTNYSSNIARWHIPHSLSVNRLQNSVTLSWPASGTNFVLESLDTFGQTNWSAVPQPFSIVNDQCVVTNDISASNRFYRLRRR